MIKTNKDLVFWIFVSIWLIVTLIPFFKTGDNFISVCIINPIFIMFAGIATLFKYKNDRFNNWLEKKIKQNYV